MLKVSGEGAGPALLDLRRGPADADKVLLVRAQQVGEMPLLPKPDSAIAGLEIVMDHPDFRFQVGNGTDTWRLDRGYGNAG